MTKRLFNKTALPSTTLSVLWLFSLILYGALILILAPTKSFATENCGNISRTPDSSFSNLSDYNFSPHYIAVQPCNLRLHYLDEGPRNGKIVLLAHGNPAWSYMYRNWIPQLTARGYRVIVPDLIGFGKSDKLAFEQYTYARQIRWMSSFVRRLNLQEVNLYAQDWGGLIFLRVVADNPQRFARIAVSNTALPDGSEQLTPEFIQWRDVISQTTPVFGPIIDVSTVRVLTPAEIAAYDAPWLTEELRQAPRAMPKQVPDVWWNEQGIRNRFARSFFQCWRKPFLVLWSTNDRITPGWDNIFRTEIPGAQSLPHKTYNGGHFIQEDFTNELVADLINLIETY